MTKRIKKIVSHIEKCRVFVDVGCDHGLVSKYVLDNNLADKVIATDISSKSLDKAIKSIDNEHIGRFFAICCDGFSKILEPIDQACIAGMGGIEICKILSNAKFLPTRLILQPMKNAKEVRSFLTQKNYPIVCDYLFYDGDKFYDVIVADKMKTAKDYSSIELEFGRDNLLGNPDFIVYLTGELEKLKNAKEFVKSQEENQRLEQKIEQYLKVINNENN